MQPAETPRILNYINKVTTLDNVRIHSLWDTVYSGQSQMSPELHNHCNHEIQVCTHGEYLIDLESGAGIPMGENDVCLIPRETLHASRDGRAEPRKLALRFYIEDYTPSAPVFGLCHQLQGRLDALNAPLRVQSPQIAALMSQIHAELYEQGENAGALCGLLLVEFFAAVFKTLLTDTPQSGAAAPFAPDNRNTRAYKIETFFSKRCADQIVEEDLAAYLNLSLRQTTREIRRLYGVTFREELIRIRMRRAATLLVQTNLSTGEIAAEVGYTSASSFCAAFRRYFGLAPSAYKRQNKNRM